MATRFKGLADGLGPDEQQIKRSRSVKCSWCGEGYIGGSQRANFTYRGVSYNLHSLQTRKGMRLTVCGLEWLKSRNLTSLDALDNLSFSKVP